MNRSSRVRMEAWRQRPLGGRRKPCSMKLAKNRLDSDRPSHGRRLRSLRIGRMGSISVMATSRQPRESWPHVKYATPCGWQSQSRDTLAVGNILFGHFNQRTPKWKRVTKVVLVLALVGVISAKAGPAWGLAPIALMLVVAAVVHLWWLPRHGINGLTGEPREKYYELRGWTRKP